MPTLTASTAPVLEASASRIFACYPGLAAQGRHRFLLLDEAPVPEARYDNPASLVKKKVHHDPSTTASEKKNEGRKQAYTWVSSSRVHACVPLLARALCVVRVCVCVVSCERARVGASPLLNRHGRTKANPLATSRSDTLLTLPPNPVTFLFLCFFFPLPSNQRIIRVSSTHHPHIIHASFTL